MLNDLISKYKSNAVIKNLMLLMSGSIIAQVFPVLVAPILSRLYSPDEFGILGTVVAYSGVLIALGAFRMELGFVFEKKNEKKLELLRFCFQVVSSLAVISLFCFLCYYFVRGIENKTSSYLFFVPVVFLVSSMILITQHYLNSEKLYKVYSYSQVLRTIFTSVSKLVAGFFGFGVLGLVVSVISGSIISLFYIFKKTAVFSGMKSIKLTCDTKKSWVNKNIKFIKYTAPQDFLNSISSQLPVFILGYYYGVIYVGFYWFCIGFLRLPIAFIGNATRNVFYKEITDNINNISYTYKAFVKATVYLFLIALPLVFIVYFFGVDLFIFIFGEKWKVSGEMSKWLVFWVGISLCNIPTVQLFYVFTLQKNLLIYEISLTASRLLVLLLCSKYLVIIETIKYFSLVGFVFNVLLILTMLVYLRNKIKIHELLN